MRGTGGVVEWVKENGGGVGCQYDGNNNNSSDNNSNNNNNTGNNNMNTGI
jgi:hypothetical protein